MPTTLRTVSNDAPGFDVARDRADRKTRLVAQAPGKLDEAMRVGEVADEAERHADGARALAAAAGDEIEKSREVHVLRVEGERGAHVLFGNAFGGLARTRVAEAAGAQRDPLRAGHLLDTAVIQQVPLGVVEVQRD